MGTMHINNIQISNIVHILPFELPPGLSMVGLGGKYGFVFLPKSKSAEIELVYQVLWQPLPSKISIGISENCTLT